MISYQVTQPLHGDKCSVIVEAKIGGKKAEAQWSFTLSEPAAPVKDAPAAASLADAIAKEIGLCGGTCFYTSSSLRRNRYERGRAEAHRSEEDGSPKNSRFQSRGVCI